MCNNLINSLENPKTDLYIYIKKKSLYSLTTESTVSLQEKLWLDFSIKLSVALYSSSKSEQ